MRGAAGSNKERVREGDGLVGLWGGGGAPGVEIDQFHCQGCWPNAGHPSQMVRGKEPGAGGAGKPGTKVADS